MRKISAALCSFFIVGLGQIMNDESEKGLKFMLLTYFVIPALLFISFFIRAELFLMLLGFFTIFLILFWAYNVFDAWRTAE